MNGTNWVWNILLTASLFSLPFFTVWSTVNTVAWYYKATQALPWTTVLLLIIIWLLSTLLFAGRVCDMCSMPFCFAVGFPLTVLGGIIGKNTNRPFDAPTRTKNIPREIPVVPW